MMDSIQLNKEEQKSVEAMLKETAKIDMLAKQFEYNQGETMGKNLARLCEMLIEHFQLSSTGGQLLRNFLIEPNIPIEYTFKPLKSSQVASLMDGWLGLSRDATGTQPRVYSNNHRNILFKRVLFEEKETIEDYFSTLSPRSMLKAVNLYPILVQILTPYHLYEYNTDSETFFDKVNSLNSFVEVVDKFIHSEKRIVAGATATDFDMVRRYQFERMIQFWQKQNPQLTLLAEKRTSRLDQAVQTIQHSENKNTVSTKTQTHQIDESLSEVINGTLQSLNNITLHSQDPDQLQIIDRICSQLRKEKITLLRHHTNQHQQSSLMTDDSAMITQKTERNVPIQPQNVHLSLQPKVPRLKAVQRGLINRADRDKSPSVLNRPSQQRSHRPQISHQLRISTAIEDIYGLYADTSLNSGLLEGLLNDLGAVRGSSERMVQQFMGAGLMRDRHFISRAQFEEIMQYVMENDRELTVQVLQEFVEVKKEERKRRSKSRGHGRVRTESQWVGSRYSRNYAGRYLAPYY